MRARASRQRRERARKKADTVLVQNFRDRLVWIDTSAVAPEDVTRPFKRAKWKVVRVDISGCRTPAGVADALAALYPWPKWRGRDLDAINDWFLEMFDAFRTKRLCVVFDRGTSNGRITRQDELEGVLLSLLSHVRNSRGNQFLDGTVGDWELAVLWLSPPGDRPQMPDRYSAVAIEKINVPTRPVKKLGRVLVSRRLYES